MARTPTILSALLLAACEGGDPSYARVHDAYDDVAVFRAWWSVAGFYTPVAAGARSERVRVVPDADYAYALLAPDGVPEGGVPERLIPVRSRALLSVKRGHTLDIVLSADSVLGDCERGEPLDQEDADFITTRLFPGEFANVDYDAATCTATPR